MKRKVIGVAAAVAAAGVVAPASSAGRFADRYYVGLALARSNAVAAAHPSFTHVGLRGDKPGERFNCEGLARYGHIRGKPISSLPTTLYHVFVCHFFAFTDADWRLRGTYANPYIVRVTVTRTSGRRVWFKLGRISGDA